MYIDNDAPLPLKVEIKDETDLTVAQEGAVTSLMSLFLDNGTMPTLRELGVEMGIGSTNGVACHLQALERKGWVGFRGKGKSRGTYLTDKAYKAFGYRSLKDANDIAGQLRWYVGKLKKHSKGARESLIVKDLMDILDQ